MTGPRRQPSNRPGRADRSDRAGHSDRADAEAARDRKLRELQDTLAAQVTALQTGQDWKRWLTVAARLRTYSFQNTLLIGAQRLDATVVAGYQAWRAMGRQVNKGEKGIAILAPVTRRVTSSTDPATAHHPDSHDGQQRRDADGRTAPDRSGRRASSDREGGSDRDGGPDGGAPASRRVTGFRVTYVWDIAQTTGRPLPEPPTPQVLRGQAPDGLWDALAGLVAASGYRLERGPCGDANGVTIPAARLVRVQADLDDAQAAKTLVHELAHVWLHTTADTPHTRVTSQGLDAALDPGSVAGVADPDPRNGGVDRVGDRLAVPCRGIAEVEAESVAFLVTAAHGLDSGAYTFPYVAHWAHDVPGRTAEDLVRLTGQRVHTTAARILDVTQPLPDHLARNTSRATSRSDSREQPDDATRDTTANNGSGLTDAVRLAERADRARRATQALAARAEQTRDQAEALTVRPLPVRRPDRLEPGPVGRVDLLEAHRVAAEFYRRQASESWVREYLERRDLSVALATPWDAGYAPAGWTTLVDHLRGNGFPDPVLLGSGLCTRARTGNLVDRFRDRLMLPVRDSTGVVVGFVGRARPGTDPDRVPKYLNSPQTPLYSKGELLHGLTEGAPALARGARPVLVEGPLDAIAVTTGTARRCVGLAVCGTALTGAHIDAVLAAADVTRTGIVVAADADPAGLAVAETALALLSRHQVVPLTAALPAGTDPADLLLRHGPAALTAALLENAYPLSDQVLDAHLDTWRPQLRWIEGRVGALRAVAPLVASLALDDVGRQATRLARLLDLDTLTVHQTIAPHLGTDPAPRPRTSGGHPGRVTGQAYARSHADNARTPPSPSPTATPPPRTAPPRTAPPRIPPPGTQPRPRRGR